LDPLSDSNLVPQTVASVFDIRETHERPVIEILTNVLREKTTLLILDNCEHLLDACAQLITTLLVNCPNLRVLAASREVLNVTGEATYQMPSLSMPEQNNISIEKLTEYESIRLFKERAASALTSFTLTKENTQAVIDICRRVDGVPLAIELAAARVNILQVEEILKQLQNSFALLSTDNRITLSHHQTLQASLDWSWHLLNEAEQAFMRQLAVFAGGWTLESAQAVCDGDIFGLTNALVKKSLIGVNQEAGRETRYRFHEIVRQYAHEKLVGSGEEKSVCIRHLKYFLGLSEQIEPSLHGPQQAEWSARASDERDNLRAALEQAAKTDIEAGLYISGRLKELWEIIDIREGARWLAEFIGKPESKDYPRARARALFTQAWFLTMSQQFQPAHSAAQESLALFRACGDQQGEADALLMLGIVMRHIDNLSAAVEFSQQALALCQTLGDKWRQARAFFYLGSQDGNHQLSFVYWEEAVALFREVGDSYSLTIMLSILGFRRTMNGDLDLAQKHLNEATLLWSLNKKADIWEELKTAKGLIAFIRGDYEQAYALLQEIAVSTEELGNQTGYLWARVRLGYVALRVGNINEARQIFTESTHNFQKRGNTIGVVFALEGLASLSVEAGKPEHAVQLIGWADATREKIVDTRPPVEQAEVDKIITAIIGKMGVSAFEEAYESGRGMTMDEVVALALE